MIVLIPSFQPSGDLVTLVESLLAADSHSAASDLVVVVVDDGSGGDYDDIFDATRALGCEVIRYGENRGKGHALKVGFSHIAEHYPDRGVVCADGDGQHAVADILRVADHLRQSPDALVLGTRTFRGAVPLRSRCGNALSQLFFQLATGRSVPDTQTGLRGCPGSIIDWLGTVPGDRYEYEFTVLLRAADAGIAIETVDIATIYLESNASSHFRPVADSVRIYLPLLAFALSSISAFVIDWTALLLLSALTGSLLVSVVGARLLSSAANFATNRRLVFRHRRDRTTAASAVRYFSLVAGLLTVNYLTMAALQAVGIALLAAKLITEIALFTVSFAVQRRFVFPGSSGQRRRIRSAANHRARSFSSASTAAVVDASKSTS